LTTGDFYEIICPTREFTSLAQPCYPRTRR
jgi:hypothetical protein